MEKNSGNKVKNALKTVGGDQGSCTGAEAGEVKAEGVAGTP